MSEWEDVNEVVWRRFGPKHEKPCNRPGVTTCALWDCQHANRCLDPVRPAPRSLPHCLEHKTDKERRE